MKRSKWTMIYWDLDPETGKLAPYIRLVPNFMDLEDAGYPHGLSLGGFRPDEADAKAFAESVDRFMDALIQQHGQEWPHAHICKFNESTFVWYDETEQPGGVETTFEAAKEALRKYGEQLEATPISRAAQLIDDWDSGHPAYDLSELGAEAVELLRIVLYNTPQKLDERETFEVWFKTLEAGLSLDGIKALHMAKEGFWQGWQARANK